MKSLWDDNVAKTFADDPLQLRVYSSRLLGREPGLILHGGGNTSVKTELMNLFGDKEEILFVKGSGGDLAQIQANGFAPLRLKTLKRIVALDRLADSDMIRIQRSAVTDSAAPDPSIETLVHASIPFKYVDHTHADAVITLSNNARGDVLIREIYKDRLLIVPYVKPGFMLAKKIQEITRNADWKKFLGMILMHHGVFSFADDAQTSYERMIHIVSLAEEYLQKQGALNIISKAVPKENLRSLSQIRQHVSLIKGSAMLARLDNSPEACGFAGLPKVKSIATRGPITADHLIHIKPFPVVLDKDVEQDISNYSLSYKEYFDRNTDGYMTCLDSAPRWGVWPQHGTIAFGQSLQETVVVSDIVRHTIRAMQWGEAIGGWKPLSEKETFDMEYWELQQAKLRKKGIPPDLQGKIALVTGAASGIGLACAKMLQNHGAAVVGLDINPEVTRMFDQQDMVGIRCDITDEDAVKEAVQLTVRSFGGLDILIPNAGIFPVSQNIEEMDNTTWERSMAINLTSNQRLLKICIPYLRHGIDPTVVFIASKNVPAPGPGAAAYSVAKAGQTQLARIAAMELGPDGIRVNIVHPNAVYDTALWTPEVLESRACKYGCTVEEYKTNNYLKTEVTSKDVAALVCAMVGPAFAKTTGAQVPIDGGNDRVI
jgi:rhamnose utilization protein RhaD (predicted bifunctional aldolase and dehydrogenase)/NAD(P)-dependent dehydrogenase (short-subunit alcohol dehydrogenase family)